MSDDWGISAAIVSAISAAVGAGTSIASAVSKPATPKPPSQINAQSGILARQRAAQAKGLSSTVIAGRSALGVPGGTPAA